MKTMKLGLQLGYWGSGPPPNAAELVTEADRLGFDSVWTAESYGSDALTPLAWWGSRTEPVRLGHRRSCQLSARTPTAMAMAALTMDHLSRRTLRARPRRVGAPGRRGLVRPAVPEAAGPHPRVRRRSSARCSRARAPVTNDGPHYPLPYPGGHRAGQAAEADRPPAAQRHPDRARRRGPEERGAGGGDRRRLVPDLLLPRGTWASSPSRRSTRASPGPAPAAARRTSRCSPSAPTVIDDDVDAAADGFRPMSGALHRRHGRQGDELPLRRVRPHGLTRPRRTRSRSSTSTAARTTPPPRCPPRMVEEIALVGPGREDPGRPRGVAGVARHDAAGQRRRRDAAHHGRPRPRLIRHG